MTNKQLALQSYFDQLARTREGRKRRHRYYWKDIESYCNYFAHSEHSVLEIGCGSGDLINAIKGKRKVGIDISGEMIRVAGEKYPGITFKVTSAEELNLDEKFDLVLISNLVGYLDDVQLVLERIRNVCHPQTKIIVSYYSYLWEPLIEFAEWIGIKKKGPKQNWLSHSDINNLLFLSGFDVYRTSKRMLIPFYLPAISTFFNKFLVQFPFFRLFALNMFSFAKPGGSSLAGERAYSTTVVIPARNESGNIENGLLRIPKLGSHTEIIFVEGHSKDDTWAKILEVKEKYGSQMDIKVCQQTGKGKADAVRKGFQMATGDILIILDADLSVPPEDLPKFYDAIANGRGDFINGCRLVYPMEAQAMRLLNLAGNKFFSWAFTWLLGQRFKDTLCGTKVIFRQDYVHLTMNQSYFGNFDPFGDFDLIFGAHKLNLKIVEIPIRYRERTYGSTNISRFRHGFMLLGMCFFAARKIKFI